MRVRAALDGVDISSAALIESLTIRQDSREAISTAEITLLETESGARYDVARYDVDRYGVKLEIREWQQLAISDQDTGQLLFAGFVLSIGRGQESDSIRSNLAASDWGILFERAVITQSWPANTFDSTIITDLLAHVPDLTAGTIVPQVANLGALEVKDARIRDVLDEVCELTGAEWSVSYDGKLNYYRVGSVVAPFALTDNAPNGTTTIGYQLESYANDFSEAANRILALGGLIEGGEIRATADEWASQAKYGLLAATVIDRNITDAATAALWAQTELATRAWPKLTITAGLFKSGLARGMTVAVSSGIYGFSASLVLRSLALTIAAPDRARVPVPGHILKYSAVLGARPPDLIYRLRRMQRQPVDRTTVPPAPPAPGSIGGGSFASTISPVFIVSAKPVGAQWDQYPADAVFLLTTDRKLYRRIAGNDWTAVVDTEDIEGQLQTHQLAPGSVTTTVLADGSAVTAKIPAGAITEPQIAASAVTANAIAANAVYAEAIQANAVTTLKIAANAVVAGKIAALAVVAGNIAADAVTAGTLAVGAVQAGDIAANAVTADTIAAGVIDSTKLNTTEIKVGGGGSKPGKINVYDAAGTELVAQLGALDGGLYGGAFKVFAAAGTSYADAKIKCDFAGNLYITNANFNVTAGGYSIYTNPTTFDASYGSLGMFAEGGTDKAALVSRGVVIYASGTNVGALVRSPSGNYGVLTLSGGSLVQCTGNDGVVRADGGFASAGAVGITNAAVPAAAVLNVRGGIIIGYS